MAAREDRSLGSQFDEPEHSPGFLLWRATMRWQRQLREVLDPLGLTHAQFVLLAVTGWLGRESALVTQARIALQASFDPMMTSQVLRTLERRGLLRRAPHPTDTRARHVVLTPTGKKLLPAAIRVVEASDRAFFGRDALALPLGRALARLGRPARDDYRRRRSRRA